VALISLNVMWPEDVGWIANAVVVGDCNGEADTKSPLSRKV
jgi:hypothetical protein